MNCSPCCSFSTGPAVAMVTGFGYAFLGAALLTRIGIIFAALFGQERRRQTREELEKCRPPFMS
ncbi:MAG TPA: hypothetical protein VFJ51_03090 [Nitrososphaeraceae archaeon]|nr:hypothetical protein [Nitrososphaeraceae archaeon]